MARREFDLESTAPPDAIIGALTNFTDRRPEFWPGINPKEYEVYKVEEKSAEIREGNGGFVWARERYEWGGDTVTWTVMDSGFAKPGSFVKAQVTPNASGGSHVHVTWQREPANLRGRLIVILSGLGGGALVRRSIRSGLAQIEALSR